MFCEAWAGSLQPELIDAYYADEPDVVWIAISEDTPTVNNQVLRDWANDKGWSVEDVQVGRDTFSLGIYASYGAGRDTWFVIGRDGRIVFVKGYGNTVSTTFPAVRQAVDEALSVVPVEGTTWGGVKRLLGAGR